MQSRTGAGPDVFSDSRSSKHGERTNWKRDYGVGGSGWKACSEKAIKRGVQLDCVLHARVVHRSVGQVVAGHPGESMAICLDRSPPQMPMVGCSNFLGPALGLFPTTTLAVEESLRVPCVCFHMQQESLSIPYYRSWWIFTNKNSEAHEPSSLSKPS